MGYMVGRTWRWPLVPRDGNQRLTQPTEQLDAKTRLYHCDSPVSRSRVGCRFLIPLIEDEGHPRCRLWTGSLHYGLSQITLVKDWWWASMFRTDIVQKTKAWEARAGVLTQAPGFVAFKEASVPEMLAYFHNKHADAISRWRRWW